jgi:hypothetical protein
MHSAGCSLGERKPFVLGEGGMPYGRQIAKEEHRQDRRFEVSEGEASREENEGCFEEQRIGVLSTELREPG